MGTIIISFLFLSMFTPLLAQWPTWASDEYLALHGCVQSLDAKRQRLQVGQSMYRTVPSLVEETVEELTPVLDFVIWLDNLHDQESCRLFEQNFCLGPLGFDQNLVTHSDTLGCFDKLDTLATPLLSLVLAFRSKTSRTQYDPPGFSDFQASLKSSEKYFGVCWFRLIQLTPHKLISLSLLY